MFMNELVVLAGASRIVFALVSPLINFVGLKDRFFASCSIRIESKMAEAAGSISHISAMIFRAFSSVLIATVELEGICGIMVSMRYRFEKPWRLNGLKLSEKSFIIPRMTRKQ